MLNTAAEIGIGEEEFLELLPRDLSRRVEAYRRRIEREDEAAWGRTLLLTNHVRTLINVTVGKRGKLKPLTLDQLKRRAGEIPPEHSKEAWIELCARIDRIRNEGTRKTLN